MKEKERMGKKNKVILNIERGVKKNRDEGKKKEKLEEKEKENDKEYMTYLKEGRGTKLEYGVMTQGEGKMGGEEDADKKKTTSRLL